MSDLVQRACTNFRDLTPSALVYHRIIGPAASR
jgi:hypothetical protein